MLSGIGPSSGDTAARGHPRAPPAIGFGVDLDRAAHAHDGPALVALGRSCRRLDRHAALARRQHPRPSSLEPADRAVSVPFTLRSGGDQFNDIVFIPSIN